MAKKSKPAPARKKTRPAAKAAPRKAAKKPVKRTVKPAARKAPAKTHKPAKPSARKLAPRKAAKKAAVKKAPVKKAPAKAAAPRPPIKKAAAAPPAAPVMVTPPPPVAAPAAMEAKPALVRTAPRPPRKRPVAPAAQAPGAVTPSAEPGSQAAAPVTPTKPGLPPIRPYRGTQSGKPSRGKGRPKKRSRDRYSKIFAEFETKPAEPARKKKRRAVDDEDEDTSISVLRERPKLQIESPEQIRAGVQKKYLETGQSSCPVGCGGIAEVVRVGTLEDGSGEVWIECLSCAQRQRFIISKVTQTERQTALHAMEEIGEALCPRHGRSVPLRRRGRDLVCPDCGVLYPEA